MRPQANQPVKYEDAAEPATKDGWKCKTCGAFYWGSAAERAARYCHATDLPCQGCGSRNTNKHYTHCESCRSKRELERFDARESREWDGKQMLYSEQLDRYFIDLDEAEDCVDEDDGVTMESMRLILCDPTRPRWFAMGEFLGDVLPEDHDGDIPEAAEVEKAVNDWIEQHSPFSWEPGKYKLALPKKGGD